jgi:hypothetical protein
MGLILAESVTRLGLVLGVAHTSPLADRLLLHMVETGVLKPKS